MQNYLHDMSIVQKYAKKNREIIADSIIKNMRLTVIENFDTIHNYIDIDNMIFTERLNFCPKWRKSNYPYEYERWFFNLYWKR